MPAPVPPREPEPGSQIPPPTSRAPRRHGRWLSTLILVVVASAVLAALIWAAMEYGIGDRDRAGPQPPADPLAVRIDAIEAELESLRGAYHRHERRIGDSLSGQRILREEVLGVGERISLLEQSLAQFAEPRRDAASELRLAEVELLLHMGVQRLRFAGDPRGALRAYRFADGLLARSDDPADVTLRQSLGEEIDALRALGEAPQAAALRELDALEASLPRLDPRRSPPSARTDAAEPASGSARLLAGLFELRRTDGRELLGPARAELGLSMLRLELAIARSAIERRDDADVAAAASRIRAWLDRLFAPSAVLTEQHERLHRLSVASLQPDVPVLGMTLEQLRRWQGGETRDSGRRPPDAPHGKAEPEAPRRAGTAQSESTAGDP